MDFRVFITEPAIEDLAEIVGHIARDNPQAAERTGRKLIAKTKLLARFPDLGRLVPERREQDCREIILRPYRIIYRVRVGTRAVEVLRFWHGARGAPQIYEPEDG